MAPSRVRSPAPPRSTRSRPFLEQVLQRLSLLRCQVLGPTAKIVHQGAQPLALLSGQTSFVGSIVFLRSPSATSPSFLATWNRSITDLLFFKPAAQADKKAAPMSV